MRIVTILIAALCATTPLLADSLSTAPANVRLDNEPLPIRGLAGPLPLWLGTGIYDNAFKYLESAETDLKGPWLNRQHWADKLKRMKRSMLNALLLVHPHPYPGLLALEDYPGACYFPPETIDKHIEQFRWILAQAKRERIKVYLLTWNICLPPQWAKANHLGEFGSDTPLSRAYTRRAVTELFETYPDLAGLVTMAGESPPGCADFVAGTIAPAINELKNPSASRPAGERSTSWPEFIFWTWCSYPEDARRVVDACPSAQLMHYLQYEQWFKPMVDPRVARFQAQTARLAEPVPTISTVTLGGPKSALAHLLWADPEWIRTLTIDLRRQGTAGLFFEPYCAESWLAEEALGLYGQNTGERYDPRPWAERVAEVYGAGQYASSLLETIQHASAIVPRFLALLHSQSDHYMPQFGLPLVYYLEMPTLSSYVFENTQALDSNGYLTPRLGLAWPNPDWGEQVASIRENANGNAPAGATTPEQIASDIYRHVITCQSRLHRLKSIKPDSPDQAARLATLLDRIELNVTLGQHFHHKIKAATAWEQLGKGQGQITDCTRPLDLSVRAWQDVVNVAERLYPKPVSYWQSQIVSPPPWSQNQIWSGYRRVTEHWRDQLPRFQRELDLVRQALSTSREHASLPLWDRLNAEPGENLMSVQRIGFEIAQEVDLRLQLDEGASITDDKTLFIAGNRSLLADTRELDQRPHVVMTTDPNHAPLLTGRPYQITIAYRVITGGQPGSNPFEVGLRSRKHGEPLGDHRFWNAPADYLGTRIIKTPIFHHSDYQLYITVHGQGAIVIDQIDIQAYENF